MVFFDPRDSIADILSDKLTYYSHVYYIFVILVSIWFLQRKFQPQRQPIIDKDWSSLCDNSNEPKRAPNEDLSNASPKELKNIFDDNQALSVKRVGKIGSSKSEVHSDCKPFNSSYYYAHNNPKAIGGYKDGLKAEDYVMNGPKLLNKTKNSEVYSSLTASAQAVTMKKNDSVPITRYLWDDDENNKGVAKIIIDTLPSFGMESKLLRWEDSGIVSKNDVKAKLTGVWKNGLMVQIIRRHLNENNSKYYHLFVPRLFGEVDEVKLILKAKKLIIKLIKKTGKENMKTWPHLHSKISPSSDATFQEDLFLVAP